MMVSDIISQYNESCSASTSNAEASQESKCDAQIVLLQGRTGKRERGIEGNEVKGALSKRNVFGDAFER